jgi:hypothetical protein
VRLQFAVKDRGQHAAGAQQLDLVRRLDGCGRSPRLDAACAAKEPHRHRGAPVDRVLEDPRSRTADLCGPLGCKAFGKTDRGGARRRLSRRVSR